MISEIKAIFDKYLWTIKKILYDGNYIFWGGIYGFFIGIYFFFVMFFYYWYANKNMAVLGNNIKPVMFFGAPEMYWFYYFVMTGTLLGIVVGIIIYLSKKKKV